MSERNVLREAILKDPELGEAVWKETVAAAKRNPFYNFLLREAIYSDYAQALGAVHDVVVKAATPNLIGREMIWVAPVRNATPRFVRAIKGKAWVAGEAETPITPERYDKVDVTLKEVKSRAEWSEAFLEDAEWSVAERMVAEVGRAISEKELEDIDALYAGITATDLATGAEITIASPITWANFCDLVNAVEREDFEPKVVALTPTVYGELIKLEQFTSSLYAPAEVIRSGVIPTTLGVTIIRSSKISQSYCIDTSCAAVLALRRDLITKPYEDPSKEMYGVLGSERYGLAVLRSKAVARGSR